MINDFVAISSFISVLCGVYLIYYKILENFEINVNTIHNGHIRSSEY